jgi:hypothetical protein
MNQLFQKYFMHEESGNVRYLSEVDENPVKILPEDFTGGGSNNTKINPNFFWKF